MGQVAASAWFTAAVIDDDTKLLDASYRLRYQVYCLERQFLPASAYHDERETDVFDAHALHVGVLNKDGAVVATARLVRRSAEGLPMFGHCSIHVPDPAMQDPLAPVVEISRLAVSRGYNRRKGDDHYSLAGAGSFAGGERRQGGEIVMTLYKALYQASKRQRYTHWLTAIELSLHRLLGRVGLPLRQIGPQTDYFGPVTPYLVRLSDWDRVIISGVIPGIADFADGLPPECFAQVAAPACPRRT